MNREEEITDSEPTTAIAKRTQELVPVEKGELVLPADVSPYQGAGTLELTPEQIQLLMTPLPDEMHDIKPTGEVFIPQVHYRSILNRVFGPAGWAMIEMSDPKAKQKDEKTVLITQKWHLVAKGCYLASAWGEMDYRPANPNTTEATAIEGAKSNALMRCCKDLGIGSECWDKTFTHKFMQEKCVKVNAPNWAGKMTEVWRRKDRPPFKGERPLAQ